MAQTTLIRLVSTTRINARAIPTNDNDYNCHIKVVELVQPVILGLYHATSCHYLLIASGLRVDTHAHRNKLISNFKKPGIPTLCRRVWFKIAAHHYFTYKYFVLMHP